MRRQIITVAVIGLLVAACGHADGAGSSTPVPPSTTTAPGLANTELPRCYDDTPLPNADEAFYRDTPKYIGNEMPVDEVRRWAEGLPGYVGIWIDREHNGWVAVAFNKDAEQRQEELAAEFPDDGVVVVPVDWSAQSLADLEQRVNQELSGVVDVLATSVQVERGYVSVTIPVLTDEAIAAIGERFASERICVEGLEPDQMIPAGPQPEAGDGWQLVYEQKGAGAPYTTGLAWDEESYLALIDDIEGLNEFDAGVDWESDVVIYFGAVHSGSCPNIRMDDVVTEGDTIYPKIVNTDNALACTDDANPHTYLVAVERVRLPEPPFYVQIYPDLDHDRLLVEADLRAPGSMADPGEVGPDTDPPGPQPERSGTFIEPGYPWQYAINVTCATSYLGEVNSYHWVTDEPIPASWSEAAEGRDELIVEIVLDEGDPEPTIEATHAGETIVYTPGEAPAC